MEIKDIENRIINADCMDILKQLPDKCIDCILTDPPYFGIVKNDWDNQWKNIQEFQSWVGEVGKELYRVLKDNGSFYWFGDDKTIAYCQVELDKYFNLINNVVWKKPELITKKGCYSVFRSYAPMTERCLFYDKGEDKSGLEMVFSNPNLFQTIKSYLREERDKVKEKFNLKNLAETEEYLAKITETSTIVRHYFGDAQWMLPTEDMYKKLQKTGFFNREYEDLSREYENLRREYENLRRVWNNDGKAFDVLEFPFCTDKGRFHPTQKPLSLISYLLERSTNPDMLVLDCFSGSGTTAIACHRLKRRFICIEKDTEYAKASVKRLEDEQRQGVLF